MKTENRKPKTDSKRSKRTMVLAGFRISDFGFRFSVAAFSYIEAVVAIFILGLGVTAGMNLYGSYARAALSDQEALAGRELAAGLMSEILAKYFEDPTATGRLFGPEALELSRADYDDVDDYNGGSQSPPANPDGSPLAPGVYDGYTRSVVVQNVNPTNLTQSAANGSTAAKRITIKITRRGRDVTILTGYRYRNDAYN
jgi:type II secretory pathway pseudopilin PulG